MLFSLTKSLYKLSYNVQWIQEQRTVGLNFHRVIYYHASYVISLGLLYYKFELFFVRKKPRPSKYWVSYGWKPCKPSLFVDLQIYWRTVYALKDHRCVVWNIQKRAAASVRDGTEVEMFYLAVLYLLQCRGDELKLVKARNRSSLT